MGKLRTVLEKSKLDKNVTVWESPFDFSSLEMMVEDDGSWSVAVFDEEGEGKEIASGTHGGRQEAMKVVEKYLETHTVSAIDDDNTVLEFLEQDVEERKAQGEEVPKEILRWIKAIKDKREALKK